MITFPGKVGLLQRVLPRYRVPFFERLAPSCDGGLEVFAGDPRPEEGIVVEHRLDAAKYIAARNVHIGRGRFYLCWQREYRRWLNQSSPDALIVSANPRILTTHLAIRKMRSRGCPVIGWGLGTLGKSSVLNRRSPGDRLRSRFFRSFDALIAYSSKAAEDYGRAGVPAERIFVARNAVSNTAATAGMDRYKPGGEEVRQWRQRLGLSRPTVICVGRLIPEKRLDLLIEACGDIGDRCDLVIVGDGPERAALETLAGVRFPRTIFLGRREGDDLAIAFAASDLFVLPGNGGLAIHEAMAHGKPVIVGRGDGTESDLVQEGRNGRLVAPDDLGALTAAIKLFLEHPEGMRLAGIESQRIASDEVSIDGMVYAFVQALHFAAGHYAARPGGPAKEVLGSVAERPGDPEPSKRPGA